MKRLLTFVISLVIFISCISSVSLTAMAISYENYTIGTTASGSFNMSDADYLYRDSGKLFKFTIENSGKVTFNIKSRSNNLPYDTKFDSGLSMFLFSSSNINNSVIGSIFGDFDIIEEYAEGSGSFFLKKGIYYFSLQFISGNAGDYGEYTISSSFTKVNESFTEVNQGTNDDAFSNANTIKTGKVYYGMISDSRGTFLPYEGLTYDEDYYKVQLSGKCIIKTSGNFYRYNNSSSANSYNIKIFNGKGGEIDTLFTKENGASGSSSLIYSDSFSKGTYYIDFYGNEVDINPVIGKYSFEIIKLSTTSLTKLTPKKKSVLVKWKKKTTNVNGYQVQCATNKKFTKNKKSVNITKNATTKTTIKKLKGGKKYYIRIRTYKKINGKKYYGPWSKAKTVTTKK